MASNPETRATREEPSEGARAVARMLVVTPPRWVGDQYSEYGWAQIVDAVWEAESALDAKARTLERLLEEATVERCAAALNKMRLHYPLSETSSRALAVAVLRAALPGEHNTPETAGDAAAGASGTGEVA